MEFNEKNHINGLGQEKSTVSLRIGSSSIVGVFILPRKLIFFIWFKSIYKKY